MITRSLAILLAAGTITFVTAGSAFADPLVDLGEGTELPPPHVCAKESVYGFSGGAPYVFSYMGSHVERTANIVGWVDRTYYDYTAWTMMFPYGEIPVGYAKKECEPARTGP